MNSIKEWTESPSNDDGELGDKSLGSYLQQITLLTDADEDKENSDVVKLMTIHAAKGLEFACVFVGGLKKHYFQMQWQLIHREELEEERRLFYVAITRAKKNYGLPIQIPDIGLDSLYKMSQAGLLKKCLQNILTAVLQEAVQETRDIMILVVHQLSTE
jgi:ATP-dependent exoDNAse (exonuclease V) beta subunit